MPVVRNVSKCIKKYLFGIAKLRAEDRQMIASVRATRLGNL